MILMLLACNGGTSDSAAPATLPDFNYIPINDEACNAFSDAYEAEAVSGVLTDIVENNSHFAAEGLEVCGPDMVSSCDACTPEENPLYGAIGAIGSASYQTSLSEYFRKALSYPHRFAVASADLDSETGVLVLSQAKGTECGLDPATDHIVCDTYELQPESLDDTCAEPSLTFPVATQSVDGGTRITSGTLANGRAFGFYVPILEELPDPTEFATDAELQAWVQTQPKAAVTMEYPSIDVTIGDDGAACGRLTGYVRAELLAAFASDPDVLLPYLHTDPSGTIPEGYIQAILALDLDGTDAFTAPTAGGDR